ncbi:MAG: PIN domain-containing protein [Trueperaceae bacterium]|nr:PIN domain-containing protein [Trueperaceae bacterium]
MEPLKTFLDANILFSAAVGGPVFDLLWSLGDDERLVLLTSRTCLIEAERNLKRKRRHAMQRFGSRTRVVHVVPDVTNDESRFDLPPKDAPIYGTAVAIGADIFLTGDLRHFGGLMRRTDVPVRVRTVRSFLLESLE